MERTESLEDFYKRKATWIPENLRNEIGHFNLNRHVPVEPGKTRQLPYRRRDFYKIMLVEGDIDMHYADKVVNIEKQALFFSNPLIPYQCTNLENIREGVYCIFNQQFFHHRFVKETTGKTTSQLIGERILQEAKILLKHSPWNVSEIAFSLGFSEVTHFNNFFKKQVGTSPGRFRNN